MGLEPSEKLPFCENLSPRGHRGFSFTTSPLGEVWATIQLCLLGTAPIMNRGARAGVSPLFGFSQNLKLIFRKVDLFKEYSSM